MIRHATIEDLPSVVAIYNASIPGRMATADTQPVTVEQRVPWFREFDPARRPLWVGEGARGVEAWLSLRSFYGRPAYASTVEVGVYVDPAAQRRGWGRKLLEHARTAASTLRLRTFVAFVFAHNTPSIALFRTCGFDDWGRLPRVAELDGVERDLAILGARVDGGMRA